MKAARLAVLGVLAIVLSPWQAWDLTGDDGPTHLGSCPATFLKQLKEDPNRSDLVINLCQGVVPRKIRFQGAGTYDPEHLSWLWEGTPDDARGGALILLQKGQPGQVDKVGGLVFVDDEMYWLGKTGVMIRTMAREQQSVWERWLPEKLWRKRRGLSLERIDPASLPPDHPPESAQTSELPIPDLEPGATLPEELEGQSFDMPFQDPSDGPIQVLVAYTQEAVEEITGEDSDAVDDIAFHALLMEEITNWSFRLSGVDVAVELTVEPSPITRDPNSTTKQDVDALSCSKGDFAHLHRRREAKSLDLIALVSSYAGKARDDPKKKPSCGYSWPCAAHCRGSDGFFVVDWWCATTKLSFAHELGHILGATHNPEKQWDCSNTGSLGAVPRGYCSKILRWRTVMAEKPAEYCGGRPGCAAQGVRLPFWSNPDRDYLGEPTGTKSQDNASLLEGAARLVAGFRTAESRRLVKKPGLQSFSEIADLCRSSDSVAAAESYSSPSGAQETKLEIEESSTSMGGKP